MGFKLFGVQIDAPSNNTESRTSSSSSVEIIENPHDQSLVDVSQIGTNARPASRFQQRKRGTPWSWEEHRQFLMGLEELGKGDWRGISKKYVPSRSSVQVASHAQKYYKRIKATAHNKGRRKSVFDVCLPKHGTQEQLSEPIPVGSSSFIEPAAECSLQPRASSSHNEGFRAPTTPPNRWVPLLVRFLGQIGHSVHRNLATFVPQSAFRN